MTSKTQKVIVEIMASSVTRVVLSILLGFLFGGIFMVLFNENVVATYANFFSAPGDTFAAAFQTIVDGYGALIRGAIFNPNGKDVVAMFRPITETLRMSAPLIMAGLGLALGFRVGLFNIGGTGQIVMGLVASTWVSTRMDLPPIIHMIVALIAAVVDYRLSERRLPIASWVREPKYVLSEPWDVEPIASLRAAARRATPLEIKRHGIFLAKSELASV
mgnify:CR=1 FL=1